MECRFQSRTWTGLVVQPSMLDVLPPQETVPHPPRYPSQPHYQHCTEYLTVSTILSPPYDEACPRKPRHQAAKERRSGFGSCELETTVDGF
ncbi:hypothetical protein JAAARDRAFT_487453 [Jaapia argillacea MUCL 33604]|uniref:Uncharacterized protein n=1 Tax=Jaapia argillacea MUCL 33604 TaxID=933084 RepID=A0A067PEL6_9AGAM|nr:hypothetical protein JAAARDRAFT_487453 [Jaapia argillacea MUCL 33604]